MMNLRNYIFLCKILLKKWSVPEEKAWWHANSRLNLERTLLTPDQIYCVFDFICTLRKYKLYKLSDYLKNKLCKVGFHIKEWKSDKIKWDPNRPVQETLRLVEKAVREDLSSPMSGPGLKCTFLRDRSIIEGKLNPDGNFKNNPSIYCEI